MHTAPHRLPVPPLRLLSTLPVLTTPGLSPGSRLCSFLSLLVSFSLDTTLHLPLESLSSGPRVCRRKPPPSETLASVYLFKLISSSSLLPGHAQSSLLLLIAILRETILPCTKQTSILQEYSASIQLAECQEFPAFIATRNLLSSPLASW